MKRIFFLATVMACVLLTLPVMVYARSWRINNDVSRKASFVDINAACASDDVMDGDFLYLDPGCDITTEQNITKRVTVVGPGYFLADMAYVPAMIRAKLTLSAEGVILTGLYSTNDFYIKANNVTIERCKVNRIMWQGMGEYATIRQCYLICVEGDGAWANSNSAYCTIENCVIDGKTSNISIQKFYSPTVRYNFVSNDYYTWHASVTSVVKDIVSGSITNNIIIMANDGSKNGVFENITNCQVTNNILSCAPGTYPDYPNNTCIDTHEITGIFICEGNTDRYYEMTQNSLAAIHAVGPFYGLHPYVFSGLPYRHPYYTNVTVSPQAQDGKVSVSLKGYIQNE